MACSDSLRRDISYSELEDDDAEGAVSPVGMGREMRGLEPPRSLDRRARLGTERDRELALD